jgi:hypothetical protein
MCVILRRVLLLALRKGGCLKMHNEQWERKRGGLINWSHVRNWRRSIHWSHVKNQDRLINLMWRIRGDDQPHVRNWGRLIDFMWTIKKEIDQSHLKNIKKEIDQSHLKNQERNRSISFEESRQMIDLMCRIEADWLKFHVKNQDRNWSISCEDQLRYVKEERSRPSINGNRHDDCQCECDYHGSL